MYLQRKIFKIYCSMKRASESATWSVWSIHTKDRRATTVQVSGRIREGDQILKGHPKWLPWGGGECGLGDSHPSPCVLEHYNNDMLVYDNDKMLVYYNDMLVYYFSNKRLCLSKCGFGIKLLSKLDFKNACIKLRLHSFSSYPLSVRKISWRVKTGHHCLIQSG